MGVGAGAVTVADVGARSAFWADAVGTSTYSDRASRGWRVYRQRLALPSTSLGALTNAVPFATAIGAIDVPGAGKLEYLSTCIYSETGKISSRKDGVSTLRMGSAALSQPWVTYRLAIRATRRTIIQNRCSPRVNSGRSTKRGVARAERGEEEQEENAHGGKDGGGGGEGG